MQDSEIIHGLLSNNETRPSFENHLYGQYKYLINEGCRKYNLSYDESFSAYSDAVLLAIHNVINRSFNNASSLKTYLFQIFSNKCIDLVRKKTTNKQKVHQSALEPDLLSHLPDVTKNVIERLIDAQKLEQVRQCLEVIGEKCKKVLLLFEDGYTDREIAKQLSYNNAAVAKTTRLRCLEKIKNLFTHHG